MRLFFSIPFSEAVRDSLCAAMDRIRPCCGQGRFTLRENLHLTLVFLGEVPSERLPDAKDAMTDVPAAGFPLEIGGIGCFSRREGSLYWAGVERSEPLCALYDTLCEALRRRGFQIEDRPYHPHLTLVRQAVLKSGCDRTALTVPVLRTRADSLSLMRSELRDGRRIYTEITRKELVGTE